MLLAVGKTHLVVEAAPRCAARDRRARPARLVLQGTGSRQRISRVASKSAPTAR